MPLYHKLFPNKETPALPEKKNIIKVGVKTEDMDDGAKKTEAKEEDSKEKEARSGESVEEDGFVLVLDR